MPKNKLIVIGGGIAGFMEVLYRCLLAELNNEELEVTILDQNSQGKTTTFFTAPSISPDEIFCLPSGAKLKRC
jgi:glycine/D-amino acid oxidase-like deaminating enzyme